ncbi:hypothetical protein HWV03_08040 [Moritella sp. 36]|uniref:hypothetical protein n=1 Tax=Moritella sp. 36 TaxID=2746233 RepID=UPI001BA86A23|nr:hypothetical protein [Moritella sp. 36]QUM88754.1 hypothetical protein HWV03_08040 [Moritella sp. 36]
MARFEWRKGERALVIIKTTESLGSYGTTKSLGSYGTTKSLGDHTSYFSHCKPELDKTGLELLY